MMPRSAMPPGAWRYTVVGFSIELDWKPLVFIKPLKQFKVCSACGLVRRKTAVLPCCHTLCEDCYKQSVLDGACTCPRDGFRYELPGAVAWEEFHLHQLLKLQVKCVNEKHGCGRVMIATEMGMHLKHQCEHHATCCPVCSDTILCKSICAHLRLGCDTRAAPPALQLQGELDCMDATQILASYRETMQSVVEKMKASLDRLVSDSKVQSDRLSGLSSRIRKFDETVEEQISHKLRVFEESMSNHVYIQESVTAQPVAGDREIKASQRQIKKGLTEAMKKNLNILMNATRELFMAAEKAEERLLSKLDLFVELSRKVITLIQNIMARGSDISSQSHEILADVMLSIEAIKMEANKATNAVKKGHTSERILELTTSSFEFFVKYVNALYNSAHEDGVACYGSRQVYVHGHCVIPNICIVHTRGTLTLHIGIQLNMGDIDNTVQWPFKQIKMTVLHPNGHDEHGVQVRECRNLVFVQRPSRSISPCFYLTPSLDLTNLIKGGFAADDQLRLLYELLP